MTNGKKTWWNSWIGTLVGLGTICTMILAILNWQYDTFATDEEVKIVEQKAEYMIAQLSEKTIKGFEAVNKGFESVNKTTMQIQASIRNFSLKDSYSQEINQKYRIIKLLEDDPDNQELKIDLEKCLSRISIIENELKEIKIAK